MNIQDLNRRKVICITADSGCYFPNGEKLTVGKEYTLVWLNLYPDKCWVFLEEFPDLEFNSVHFKEVEGYQKPEGEPSVHEVMLLRELDGYSAPELWGNRQKLQAYLKKKGRAPRLLYKGVDLPKLNCAGVTVELAKCAQDIQKLRPGDIYVIGRKGMVDVNKELDYRFISRVQCYITKSMYGDGYEIYDTSAYGTKLAEA